jgi:threonine/homoserine/homoserine lactone efflux protein
MPDPQTWLLVAIASLVLVVIPGPAVIYILTRSISQGRAAGLASAVGVNLGSAIHVVGAVAGLSVILASSAILYSVVKWAGVAYLVWLGIRTLRSQDEIFTNTSAEPAALKRIFTQGVIVNVLNPKVAMFFLAFLPQFVDPDSPVPWLQSLVLGLTLVVIGLISDSVYALIGGQVGGVLRRNPRAGSTTRTASGVAYFALAGVAAVTGSRS